MGVFLSVIAFFASLLTTTKVSPGGADTTFCDPPHMISIWHASMFRGSPKEAETESTTVRIPYFLRRGQMAATSLSIPLGVSP